MGKPQDTSNYYYYGKLDEARIYNRALSAAEIRQLYNWAPGPVAHYTFEEGSGGTVADKSGYGNNGTWSGTGTRWTEGKYGKGGKFNGSSDYVQGGNGSSLGFSNGNFTVEGWFYFSNDDDGGIIISKGGYSANDGWIVYIGAASERKLHCKGNAVTGTDFNIKSDSTLAGGWHHFACLYNSGGTAKIYIDSILNTENASLASSNYDTATNLTIGTNNDHSSYFLNGLIDDVKIYNYARTAGQIVEDMNAGHPIGGSPVGSQVAYYKFDEGSGSTANNAGFGGSALNGTFGATTAAPAWNNDGKFGKALQFDGNDYVNTGNPTALQITSDLTISAWVNVDNIDPSLGRGIVSKFYNTNGNRGYRFGIGSSTGVLNFQISSDGTNSTTKSSTTAIQPKKWTYVAVVYNAPQGTADFYINGQLDRQTIGLYNSIYNVGQSFQIGTWDTNAANHSFVGKIDEVKIYNTALTADQIKLDYNQGSSLSLGSLGTTSDGKSASMSASTAYCIPGDTSTCRPPVGEWNFEEGKNGTVNDSSGNANTGTWYGTGSKHWDVGKIGTAGKFNGSDDYVDAGAGLNVGTDPFTINSWIKTSYTGGHQHIAGKRTGLAWYRLLVVQTTGKVGFELANSFPTNYINMVSTTNVANGSWHHVSATRDASGNIALYIDGVRENTGSANWDTNNAANFSIGTYGTTNNPFNGSIDQVKIYNYARTPAQIAYDYNRGAPIGHWKMDECQGTAIHDSSGNNNTGTLTNATPGTCTTSADTAWYNGRNGKWNASLKFDGTDDWVSITDFNDSGDSNKQISVFAWIKGAVQQNREIISHYDSGANQRAWLLGSGSSNSSKIQVIISDDGTYSSGHRKHYESSLTTMDSSWHLTGFTFNNGVLKIYVDGKEDTNPTKTYDDAITTILNPSVNLSIGAHLNNGTAAQILLGQIDDVQIYNYALTALQVKNLFNQGSSVRFGPAEGTP